MATVTIEFTFSDGHNEVEDFEGTGSVYDEIVERAKETAEERSDDSGEDVECDEWRIIDEDCSDYTGQQGTSDFGGEEDLNEWGEYSERVEEHGEAFVLRYDDWCGHEGLDNYEGCWASEEEFVQNLCEECCGIELPSYIYIDWERTARDIMMDYSSYEGDEGFHIFRD